MIVCFVMVASIASAATCGGVGNVIFATGSGGNGSVLSGLVSPAAASCDLGGYTFSDWTLVLASGFPGTSNTFIMNFGPGTGVSGGLVTLDFSFTGLTPGQDIRLFYSISPGILGMTLGVSGNGSANVGETICSASNQTGLTCPPGTTLANFGATANSLVTASVTFAAKDWVGKDITAGSAANSTLSEISQSIIPEPMTLTLFGAGLLGLGALGRRRLHR